MRNQVNDVRRNITPDFSTFRRQQVASLVVRIEIQRTTVDVKTESADCKPPGAAPCTPLIPSKHLPSLNRRPLMSRLLRATRVDVIA
jgi:hypothetical protein